MVTFRGLPASELPPACPRRSRAAGAAVLCLAAIVLAGRAGDSLGGWAGGSGWSLLGLLASALRDPGYEYRYEYGSSASDYQLSGGEQAEFAP